MKYNLGQSLVEVVVAIGIVALVISGMVVLMTNSLGSKTRGFDRKKAVEMSGIVMEQLVSVKNNNPDSFWGGYLDTIAGEKTMKPQFSDEYKYNVTYVNKSGGVEVQVKINWKDSQSVAFTRFFTRY
jgi:hypothetical protein